MRERINAALKEAMKAKDAGRLSTLRLISAAIKDREIAARGDGEADPLGQAAGAAGRVCDGRLEEWRSGAAAGVAQEGPAGLAVAASPEGRY